MNQTANNSPVSAVNMFTLKGNVRKLNDDIVFLIILGGEITVQIKSKTIHLYRGDILMIQGDEYPVYSASGNNLVLFVSFVKEFFAKNNFNPAGHLILSSVDEPDCDYSEPKRILAQIALSYFKNSKLENLHQTELSFSLLYYLSCYHYIERPVESTYFSGTDRESLILNYLEQNYMNPVTLNDIAKLTHLNTSYLSRFFRKSTGETLNSRLQNIRLQHALIDLNETNKSITNIAYENGFPSPAAFCKTFTAVYGKTPSEYRKTEKNEEAPAASMQVLTSVDYTEIESRLNAIAAVDQESAPSKMDSYVQQTIKIDDASKNSPMTPIWNRLICLGFCTDLYKSDFLKQLKLAQDEIGFEYGRIEGLLTDKVLPQIQPGEYNFSEIDFVIDAMRNVKIKPFIDLSIRPESIHLADQGSVLIKSDKDENASGSYYEKVEALIRHCINIYGINEVKNWIFDLGIFHDEVLNLKETPKQFAERAYKTSKIIKRLLPDALVGGLTYNTGMQEEILEDALAEMSAVGFHPDFLSVCIFPYEKKLAKNPKPKYLVSDSSHPYNSIMHIRQCLAQYPDLTQSIYVAAMGPSFQTTDYINDTCFQAAYMIKNTIDLIGLVDVIGYWKLSDLSDEYKNSSQILFGSSGLISKNCLKKTGFLALKHLNRMNTRFIKKDNGVLAVSNGINTYNVVLYNYTHFNEIYCVSAARGFTVDNIYSAFSDYKAKDVSVDLKGLENGRYKLIMTTLNRKNGSLFDEWIKYGIRDNLQPMDIQYLMEATHPRRTAIYIECTDNSINFHAQLLPHEIRFYEIVKEM